MASRCLQKPVNSLTPNFELCIVWLSITIILPVVVIFHQFDCKILYGNNHLVSSFLGVYADHLVGIQKSKVLYDRAILKYFGGIWFKCPGEFNGLHH